MSLFEIQSEKAKKILKWQPQFSLDAGLQKAIKWYKNNLKYYENF